MIDVAEDVVSLTEFKRETNKYIARLARGGATVLTINGRAELAVMSAETFARMVEDVDQLATLRLLREGLDDVDAGRTMSLSELLAKLEQDQADE